MPKLKSPEPRTTELKPHDSEELQKLKAFLNELFQFESQDLDFGIYKILNYKRTEIKNFIDNLLTERVSEQLSLINEAERESLEGKVNDLEKEDAVKGYIKAKNDTDRKVFEDAFKDKIAEYKSTKSQLETVKTSSATEAQIYNHLTIFFSRYYDKGDFISKRRYSKNEKYAIPYNGEETYFYWANNDQYYIKSSEFFNKYSFKLNNTDQIVNIKISEAEEETGNVKSEEKKYFVLSKMPVEIDGDNVNLNFEYRTISDAEVKRMGKKQDDINPYSVDIIKKFLEKAKDKSIVELYKDMGDEKKTPKLLYELNRYTKRNNYDFFIHKDLRGFLTRELDFYVKNEMLNVDDLTALGSDTHYEDVKLKLKEIKAFKSIANRVIDFLAQVEDFQKKLWEKKKFIIDTHYVITLDKLAEYTSKDYIEKIIKEVLKNKNQIEEWKELFGEEILSDWKKIKPEDLKDDMYSYKKLPIDTAHFDESFKWDLLCVVSKENDIDVILDGLLLHSDNYQALNLLIEKYKDKIQSTYIDPPYNTNASEIQYKNSYKHSSWITFLMNRLTLNKDILKKDGILCITIDHVELKNLQEIIYSLFSSDNVLGLVSILNNPSGRSTVKGVSIANEFGIFIGNTESSVIGTLPRNEEQLKQYSEIDDSGSYQWRNFLRSGGMNDFRSARPKLFYPLIIKGEDIRIPNLEWNNEKKTWSIKEKPLKDEILVYPIQNNKEYTWRLGIDTLKKRLDDIRVRKSKSSDKLMIEIKFHIDEEGILPKTMWLEKKYNSITHGTSLLKNLFGESQLFSFPKSIFAVIDCVLASKVDEGDIVLDYFAGSGTTAHAIMYLNKDAENIPRKFILAEANEYIHTMIIPRIKKVAYSFDWKEGKPKNMNGLGVFFKYQRLEQYEEALENIAFSKGDVTEQIQADFQDYIPKYFLNFETDESQTFLNTESMKEPFNYTLRIFDDYKYVEEPVDLIETFNYLIGLYVSKYRLEKSEGRDYYIISGKSREGKETLVIWRDVSGLDFKKEKKFLESLIKEYEYDDLYINHSAYINKYEIIENVFKSKMN